MGSASNRLLGDSIQGLRDRTKVSAPVLENPIVYSSEDTNKEKNDPYMHSAIRTSQGGLKIFQKLSENLMSRKQSSSLRTSFVKGNGGLGFEEPKLRMQELISRMPNKGILPELPQGTRMKLIIVTNWGDSLQYNEYN